MAGLVSLERLTSALHADALNKSDFDLLVAVVFKTMAAVTSHGYQFPPAVSASPNVHGPQSSISPTTGVAPQVVHFFVQSGSVSGSFLLSFGFMLAPSSNVWSV